jgi:molybdopterin synthase catalytic subunit
MAMTLTEMIATIKRHPEYPRVGMILCHNGVARGTSRDGRPVRTLTVTVDRVRLAEIVAEMKGRPGIVEVLAEVREGTFAVGEDLMFLAVAGELREHCFPVLREAVNAIKRDVTRKTER